jgi:diguanylate cyclase (GGDEF)-like protein/PAS domain S-box-containing protein
MNWQNTPYLVPLVVSALVSSALGYYTLKKHVFPAAYSFALLMGIQALWAGLVALELSSTELMLKLLYANLQYLCYVSLPPALLALSVKYVQPGARLTLKQYAALGFIPILTLLLLWTNDSHGLMRESVHLVQINGIFVLDNTYGPWFWVHTAYSYFLLVLALAKFLGSVVITPPQYRGQPLSLMVGLVIPFAGNIAFVFGYNPIPGVDPTPLLFTLSGFIIMLGLIRFRLFEVTPIPRGNIIKSMCEGLIVLDKQGRVIDINPAAQRILALHGQSLLNRSAEQVLRLWPDLVQLCCQEMIHKIEFIRDNGHEKLTFDVRKTPLTGWRGVHVGHLLIFHDITELKRVEADLLVLSLTDHLTGLANRRKLLEIMQAEISQAVRYQLPLSVIMLDLDNLKDINDTFGHPAGDEALRIVGRVLTLSCRQADLAARLGGDEFILLLPHTPIAGAHQLSNTLKEAISSLKISQGASIGVSMGYAAFDPGQDHRGEDLISRADQALYLAKQSSKIRRSANPNQ